MAFDVSAALLRGNQLREGLYRRAIAVFGDACVAELTFLIAGTVTNQTN